MIDILLNPVAIFIVCILAYNSVIFFIRRWHKNRNQERLSSDYKLLRGPGESLWRKISQMDDKIFSYIVALAGLPFVVFAGMGMSSYLSEKAEYEKFAFALFRIFMPLALVLMALVTIKLLRALAKRRDLYLGYFGERIVSETLDAVRAKGGWVFHDVPVSMDNESVNLDHAVVCPAGVFAIETKTRRKGPVRPGFVDGRITFDGTQFIYPWGEDTHGLMKARTNAMWLEKLIAGQIGAQATPVQAILTFPGWRVEETGTAIACPVRVLNPVHIPSYIDTLPITLNEDQIKRVTRQLEALCRDVEF